ncbi:MAG: cysteine dioxygenase family protein [Planctomycetes bacterium]|nr:cysteine dioxygenase family protein [Planctomycetota bacterium]
MTSARSAPRTRTLDGLDPRLAAYVERVRAIAREPLSDVAKLRRVREAALELASGPVRLDPADRQVRADAYGRNLLYLDPDTGFVVIAMVWPPRTGSAPHDHGTWGTVAVIEGAVEVTNFQREDDGSWSDRAVLAQTCTVHAEPGAVATVLPPHEDFHGVYNASDHAPAVTIHTYGSEPREFHRVNLATGVVTLGRLDYDNLGA